MDGALFHKSHITNHDIRLSRTLHMQAWSCDGRNNAQTDGVTALSSHVLSNNRYQCVIDCSRTLKNEAKTQWRAQITNRSEPIGCRKSLQRVWEMKANSEITESAYIIIMHIYQIIYVSLANHNKLIFMSTKQTIEAHSNEPHTEQVRFLGRNEAWSMEPSNKIYRERMHHTTAHRFVISQSITNQWNTHHGTASRCTVRERYLLWRIKLARLYLVGNYQSIDWLVL